MRPRRAKQHRPGASNTKRTQAPRKRSRGQAIATGLAVSVAAGHLACVPPAPPPPPITPPAKTAAPVATAAPSVTAEPPAPAPVDPSPMLAAYSVTNKDYARRTLYTWTSDEQVDEALKEGVLLSRTESPTYGKSFYDRTIEQRWLGGDKMAALLHAPAFARARFAWTAPWATLLGWPGETYGRALIQVRLKPEAWIVMLRTGGTEYEARDMNGALVPIADVMKRPDKIAAIHFVHDAVTPPASSGVVVRGNGSDGRQAYREYVLCNESMIESWSVGTDEIARELRAGAEAAEASAKFFEQRPAASQRSDRWNAYVALLVWPGLVEAKTAKEAYEQALAFPNENYALTPDKLRVIATAVSEAKQKWNGAVKKPIATFPGARPVPIPPPPKLPNPPPNARRKFGTFY